MKAQFKIKDIISVTGEQVRLILTPHLVEETKYFDGNEEVSSAQAEKLEEVKTKSRLVNATIWDKRTEAGGRLQLTVSKAVAGKYKEGDIFDFTLNPVKK